MTDNIPDTKLLKDPSLRLVNEYVYPNGSIYRGQMREDVREGYGI